MAAKEDQLLEHYWETRNEDALRVWADALAEAGDVRGEYVQLCLLANPNAEQKKKRETLEKKSKSKLVGPAAAFLREWRFGPNGLVDRARCEADKLAAGIAEIEKLNPRLSLSVTSLKKKAVIAALGAVSLARIHFIAFTQDVMGSHGGTNIDDAGLKTLAPALAKVRNLTLSCAGYGDDCFSPDGLRALGDKLDGIEFLGFSHYRAGEGTYEDATRPRIAPIDAYAEVIATSPGFRTLQALIIRGAQPAPLRKLPNLRALVTGDDDDVKAPGSAADLEALKKRKLPAAPT